MHVDPCYWIIDDLSDDAVVVDMGLGYDADFSVAMMNQYGVHIHGFDPTRKHEPALRTIAEQSNGHFVFHPSAIGGQAGTVLFHESKTNVSGSVLHDHLNVVRDETESYEVEVLPLAAALASSGRDRVDVVKMDIEGLEYEALEAASDDTLLMANQWIIEFHHSHVEQLTFARTMRLRRRFERLGYRTYTRDNVNFLFYRLAGAPAGR